MSGREDMIHAFQFQDLFIALDVESGAVHTMDKTAFDVLQTMINGTSPYTLPYEKSDIDDIIAEFDALRQSGSLDAAALTVPEGTGESVIKAMCLHMAHDCNLRCRYCFADTGEFHGERMLMPLDVACKALDYLIAHSGSRHNLEIDLFGGEPLMNWEVLKQTVEYGRKLERAHNKKINFTITTNGVALDDEKIAYINNEMHNVVISLDGRRAVHDALRPTANGKGSFDIIVPNAQKLIAARGDREYYVRGTFTNQNLDFCKDVKALIELGFDQISLEPVVLDENSPYAITPGEVQRVLLEYDNLAEFLLQSRREGKWFNFFHFMMDMSGGPCLKKRVSGCGAGVEYVAVSPEGDVYPCHQFVGETDYCMGSVLDNTLDETLRDRFASCNILTKEGCAACWAKYFCSGGCAANAYKYNGDIHIPYEITCDFEKKRTECALGIFAKESGI